MPLPFTVHFKNECVICEKFLVFWSIQEKKRVLKSFLIKMTTYVITFR